ncbi:hypothetical protein BCV69DRAFT_131475 [Microstroma glucosiphilum]|uniref:Uncharacterized protein n=1 Tax=Pseudomicrostroma glucosiphilum TaxID=1684307 RepID=A0A316TWS5_9BASI|nr:hypothetical protein BCV69DRAFT_131475 [Pseudomicrostroma glucosiphilum]PWN17660.1 hypothetical protein BCV69DRAFT_131475 [Pseudomicrostroma glucosiphilum]
MDTLSSLQIFQLSCHKSALVMHALLDNEEVAEQVDVLYLQGPFSMYTNPLCHHRWRPYGMIGPSPEEPGFPRKRPYPPRTGSLTYIHQQVRQADVTLIHQMHADIVAAARIRGPQVGLHVGVSAAPRVLPA